ncbi:alpha/beta-hydrolase [Thozetella sp. PMI_491]|nr:alpha/beta-hydrolase [Thozetella sp. PMI_491]
MRYSLYALGLLASLVAAQFNTSLKSKTSIARTKYGTVFTNNITNASISVFKGIPYGKPPINDLRWRSPSPPDPWLRPINTTVSTRACWGFIGSNTTETTSEDCLYLNVWTPAMTASNRLPVMVWVHGGGFNYDSGLDPLFEGVNLAAKEVVVVTINYRLGNFGFFAHPGLDIEDCTGKSGNFGIQDIILALRWVRGSIQAFGGDSSNVMIFGESAGAHALGPLMASPLSEGLYDKVACSSGSWWDSEHGNMENFNQSRQRGLNWADSVAGPNATLAELRALPAWFVQNTSVWLGADPGTTAFSPNIDNFVIPRVVPATFAIGRQAKVPMLVGFNAREDTFFQNRAFDHSSATEFNDRLFSFLNISGIPENTIRSGMEKYFPATTAIQANASSFLLIGDLVIRQQTWEAIHLHEKTTGQPSWLYLFNYTSDYSPIAGHGQDVPFEFGTLEPFALTAHGLLPGAADRTFSNYLMTYYTNFAKTSNPNMPDDLNGTLPAWPAYKSCEGNRTCEPGTCGPKQGCIFQLANNLSVQKFDYGRFRFIQSFRTGGTFPAKWHDFLAT